MTSEEHSQQHGKSAFGDVALTNYALLPFLGITVFVVIVRYIFPSSVPFTTACMWAAGCLISGTVVGFLFGIPRVIQEPGAKKGSSPADAVSASDPPLSQPDSSELPDPYRQEVNSNLVDISDWLTKIIIGLGLVNLRQIPALIDRAAQILARGLAGLRECATAAPCNEYAFAVAIIVTFSVLGFLMGYLYTRLFLAAAFSRADRGDPSAKASRALLKKTEQIVREESTDSAAQPAEQVSEGQLVAAERVRELSQAHNSNATMLALRSLAQDYDRTRITMSAGASRTNKMGLLVQTMRALGLAGYSELPRFIQSSSPGERLVAIAMLQVKPNADYIPWLLERITLEKPFIAYQAIEALRRAGHTKDEATRTKLKEQLSKWVSTERATQFLAASNDRSELLKKLLSELQIPF
jgi:hypothetical protein